MRHDQTKYPIDLADMCASIRAVVPAGGRVLEIGCGDGALTRLLRNLGIDAIGIDPHGDENDPAVVRSTIEEFEGEPFDVLFASVSLHHVHDTVATSSALQRLSRPGSLLLVREFDWALLLHEPTLRWWYHNRQALEAVTEPNPDHRPLPADFDTFHQQWSEMMANHVLRWSAVQQVLADGGFTCLAQEPAPYLFRWGLHEAIRPIEEALIAEGRINQVGVHWTGRRER